MKFKEFVDNARTMANGQLTEREAQIRALFFEELEYVQGINRSTNNTYKTVSGDCILTIKWGGNDEDIYVECKYRGVVFFQQHTTKECVPGCMLELLTALTQEMLKY